MGKRHKLCRARAKRARPEGEGGENGEADLPPAGVGLSSGQLGAPQAAGRREGWGPASVCGAALRSTNCTARASFVPRDT